MNSETERKERALRCFADGLHCSRSILAAFSEECGITEEQAFRLGSCFGSGMRKGNVCGACAGALMVLGLMYGETCAGDKEGRRRTNELNDLMMNRFSEANGSCLCNELPGCDMVMLHRKKKQVIRCVTAMHHHSVHNCNCSSPIDVNDLLKTGGLAIRLPAVFC